MFRDSNPEKWKQVSKLMDHKEDRETKGQITYESKNNLKDSCNVYYI